MRQGPLAGRYFAVAAMVMFALIPYLALSAALGPLTPIIAKQLHMSLQTLSLSSGLGNAAYAVGTILAVQFAQHLPQRRMLVLYAVLLVVGCVLTAAAQDAEMFIVGHVIQGLCTSLLLIAAVPPLAIGYPAHKLRDTAVIMNMCIFGAVALGPFVGGLQAEANAWRPLFWVVAAISVVALLLAVLTFDDAPPANPDSPRDLPAIGLAAVGCVAAFFGASELTSHGFSDPVTIVPLLGGLATIVGLVTYQYRAKRPLLMVKTMLTSSIPVAGIVVALFAAAASVSATALTADVLVGRYSPVHIGLLYLPEVGGAVIAAVALGLVIRRRAMHYLPLAGMVLLAAGIAVFRIEVPSSQVLTLVGSGLTGLGLGATVAPALFVAGFSLPAANLQRVFAIVELLRAVAAFMVAPIFVHFAATAGGNLDAGTGTALWIGLGIALGGAVLGVAIYGLSAAPPADPRSRALPGRDDPGLVLATAPGTGPLDPPRRSRAAGRSGRPGPGAGRRRSGARPGPVRLRRLRARGRGDRASRETAPGRPAGARPLRLAARRCRVRAGRRPPPGRRPRAGGQAGRRGDRRTGAALAAAAGFRSQAVAVESAPTWKGIVDTAEEHRASLIVLASGRRTGLVGHLLGSVGAAVVAHATRSVLVVRPPS